MYVKIMTNEKLPDNDPTKCFSIYSDIDQFSIVRDEEGVVSLVMIRDSNEIILQPLGNVYCFSEIGSKIALFCLEEVALYYDNDDLGEKGWFFNSLGEKRCVKTGNVDNN